MSSELENIILIIDNREKNRKRIKAVEDWALSHGAIVEHSALSLCDYSLLGEFRGVSVNIGIEAKSMSDFCSCGYEELKGKLFDSFELYDEVALFIETGNYTYKFIDSVAVIDNPMVRDGSANVCPLAILEGCCSTLPSYSVHVRQLRSELQFPDSIWNLLTYITGEHHIIKRTAKDNVRTYKQILHNFMTGLQVKKAMASYPNISWLSSASEESLKAVFGTKTGVQISEILHFHDLETDEWRNNYHRDGTEKDEPTSELPKNQSPDTDASSLPITSRNIDRKSSRVVDSHYHEQQKDRVVDGIVCSYADSKNHAECKTPDHFKHHSSHQDKDISHGITPHSSLPDDTSSHPDSFPKSVTPPPQSDDPQIVPPIAAKQEAFKLSPPAETHDTSYLDEKTEYKEVKPTVIDPKAHKMSLEPTIKEFMQDMKQHSMQDIVDYCEGWSAPYIFDRIMANVKIGNIKKMTEQDGKITYQKAG